MIFDAFHAVPVSRTFSLRTAAVGIQFHGHDSKNPFRRYKPRLRMKNNIHIGNGCLNLERIPSEDLLNEDCKIVTISIHLKGGK